jgi:excisionase family DNA binding protein
MYRLTDAIVGTQTDGDAKWTEMVPTEQIPAFVGRLASLQLRLVARLMQEQLNRSASPADGDTLLRVDDAARRLGTSLDWLYRHAKRLPFTVRQGHQLRFSSQGIDRYIKQRQGQ